MLTPLGPQTPEEGRRKRLIDKRNHLLKLANNLQQPVSDELTLEEIRSWPDWISSPFLLAFQDAL